jgi:hypothetical protein
MRRQCDDIQPTGIRAIRQESWFLARCFDELAARGVRGIVSFADPVPRRTAGGAVICPGHVGTIYQATNAIYTGRGTARTIIVLPDGTTLNDRAIQKVRRQERGHLYVEQRLCSLGAPAPRRSSLRPSGSPAHWPRWGHVGSVTGAATGTATSSAPHAGLGPRSGWRSRRGRSPSRPTSRRPSSGRATCEPDPALRPVAAGTGPGCL